MHKAFHYTLKTALCLVFLLLYSCQNDQKKKESHFPKNNTKQTVQKQRSSFQNYFSVDTTLIKSHAIDFITISNSQQTDSIVSICNCDKNVKNNSITIQLETGIPTQKELDSLPKNANKRWNTVLQTRSLTTTNQLKGQFKFLLMTLKDSSVQNLHLYSKSTAKQFNGSDFDSLAIDRYQVKISKFDYSVASNVYGTFELRLNKTFGLFSHDTIVKGNFVCNNWVVYTPKKIKEINFNDLKTQPQE